MSNLRIYITLDRHIPQCAKLVQEALFSIDICWREEKKTVKYYGNSVFVVIDNMLFRTTAQTRDRMVRDAGAININMSDIKKELECENWQLTATS